MKIETTKSYIAAVNFHGASFSKPEWTISRTGDGTDLNTYPGSCIVTGNKGDCDSKEWFIVVAEEIVQVEDEEAAIEAFMFAAKAECAANSQYKNISERDLAVINVHVNQALKGFFA